MSENLGLGSGWVRKTISWVLENGPVCTVYLHYTCVVLYRTHDITICSKPSLIKRSVIAVFENYATECTLFG